MIDFYLNKIEPVSMQAIMKINADRVVHTTDDGDVEIRADSEGHNKQEAPEPEPEATEEEMLTDDKIKEKVVKLNAAARRADYKFYFVFNPQNRELCVNVTDRKTRQIIRSFGQSEIEDMLRRLTVTSGVLIDYKR